MLNRLKHYQHVSTVRLHQVRMLSKAYVVTIVLTNISIFAKYHVFLGQYSTGLAKLYHLFGRGE